MRKKVSIFFFLLFFLVFLASGYTVVNYCLEDGKQKNQYDELIDKLDEDDGSELSDESKKVMLKKYKKLYKENDELIGWIQIKNTQINYPVMQSKGEPNFYLKHLFNKTYSDYGCPFVEQKCDLDKPSDNLIIYGHHMRSDKMFSQLEKYKDKKFWEDHQYIHFDTLYEKQLYKIVATFKTVVYTDDPDMFKYYEFIDAADPAEFNAYIKRAKKMSTYDTGVSAKYGDKLITLSTCEFSNKNGRFVVVAKRIK